MRVFISAIIMMVLLSGCQSRMADVPSIRANLSPQTTEAAAQAFPVADKVGAPDGLRPCCAFGYDLQAKLGPVPVPFYTIGNVLTAGDLGEHVYNDSFWFGVAEVIGLSNENLGIIYSRHGGFIDIAHVRDTADYTYYLFTQIYPHLGGARMLILSDELSSRRIQFRRFTPPQDPAERYTLSVYLAARLAFRLAAWHEIAQWYGYHSVPGFPEEISAFTPEDLYSNLLGARLAITLLLQGHGGSVADFNRGMEGILPQALAQLDTQPAAVTRQMFDSIDGRWWDKRQQVPEKFLVLRRDYSVSDDRLPSQPAQETAAGLRLALPQYYRGWSLADLASFELWRTNNPGNLPVTALPFTEKNFPALTAHAESEDKKTAPVSVQRNQ
ncbi:DUF4056 domain-containing protein [Morganella morganii]|uniref:DUF4056 domain-containing protein n=1 Tax=Morganella morganii TaxID=582 RepID=UPI0016467F28|nr:DUF4056 domain-containing protein [Morganella morganii]MBC3996845.1 DUF4056 domain-containing protein [Morganella morganii]